MSRRSDRLVGVIRTRRAEIRESVRALVSADEVARRVRRNPGPWMVGGFLLGLAGGRFFLRSAWTQGRGWVRDAAVSRLRDVGVGLAAAIAARAQDGGADSAPAESETPGRGVRELRGDFRMKQEDLLLIARCKDGDQQAYALLLRKYQNSVYNLCRKMVRNPEEARDLSQEAFVKTFATLERYNPVYAFSSWLYKITANLCIDHIRKQRMKLFSIDEPIDGDEGPIARQLEDPGIRPDEASERNEINARVREAIEKLPEHYSRILIMRHQEQLSYEEIATALDVPLGTVKARIHRAREGLRQILQGESFTEDV